MRSLSLIPIAALVLAGGCGRGPEETGRAPAAPSRNLTLERSPAPTVQVASPLEAPRPRPERPRVQRPRRTARPEPAPAPQPVPPVAAPVAEAAAAPLTAPAAAAPRPSADAAADPHALAPGQTVTIVPVNSGPSVGSDPAEAPPSRAGRAILIGRGHGGTCQPRGAMR
jgi:hypothetical protein